MLKQMIVLFAVAFLTTTLVYADARNRIGEPDYHQKIESPASQNTQDCECSARLKEQGKPGIGTRCVPEGIICSTREAWLDDEDPLPVIACKAIPGDPPTCEEIRTALVDPLACSYGHKDASECVGETLPVALGTHCGITVRNGELTCELHGRQERAFPCSAARYHPGRDTFQEIVSCDCKPGERCDAKICMGVREHSTNNCQKVAEVARCVSRGHKEP
jgi:hypothetical protein